MKFKEVLKRINGVSGGVFGFSAGVSWNPIKTDKDHVKEIIVYLEDRRVLYNPSEMEVPHHCIESVLDIRRFLTAKISDIQDKHLVTILKGMRSACRKFLDSVGANGDIVRFGSSQGHWASWSFNGAVGELRGVFGLYLAELAVLYKLDIEDGLASILPISDEGK
jgi:hypothetical protein